jgi:hypothetical protein
VLRNAKIGTVQKFEVTSEKFNIVTIFTSGNYAEKWIAEYCNYKFLCLARILIQNEALEGR